MGKIKKITENELVGGTQNTDVYPVTSVKAVYDENNERLDNILNRRGVVNISTNYNADHIAEVLTLEQAIAKVPSKDRVLGFQGKFLSENGWKSYVFIGDSIVDWTNKTKWNNYLTGTDIVQESGEAEDKVMSQKVVNNKLAELESNKNIILYGAGKTRPSGIKVGDIYYNIADNMLYKIVDSTPDYVAVPFVAGNLYTLNNFTYIYDGHRLVLSSIITIAQIGPSGYINVPVYSIFYNTSTKLLGRKKQDGSFETVPFVENALYSCAGQLYYWNGDDLVTVYSSNKHIAIKSRDTYYKINDDIQAGDWIIVDFQSSSVLDEKTQLLAIKENGDTVILTTPYIGAGLYAYKISSKYIAFYLVSPNVDVSADINIIKPYDSVINYITAHTEHGSFESDYGFSYNINYFSNRLRSSYMINVNGAKAIHISGLPNTSKFNTITLYCFKADYTFIAEISTLIDNFTALPDECKYIRFKCNTENDIKSVVITSFYGGEMTEEKNIQYANESEPLIFEIGNGQFTTARLMLPPNYSANGKSCPMILYLQGSDLAVNMNFELGKGVTEGVHYLRDEGYAVLEIFGWGNYYYSKYPNCGHAYPYPTPTGLKCVKSGIEYVLSHFNVDKNNLHILSWSQGGQNSLYYVTHNEFNFKTINMIAPVLDYLSMPGGPAYADARKAIAEDLGLESDCVYQGVPFNGVEYFGSTEYCSYFPKARVFFERNIDKMQYLNEAWMRLVGGNALERLHEANDDAEHFWTTKGWEHPEDNSYYNNTDRTFIGEHVSVQMWCAKDDDQTPYRKVEEVSQQLQNGGIECKMNVVADGLGGHYSVAQRVKVPVTTSLGISYTAVPVAFVQTVSFIRSKKW